MDAAPVTRRILVAEDETDIRDCCGSL